MIRGASGWGVLCYSDSPMVTREVGEVICRQTESQFLARIHTLTNYGGVQYSGTIRCAGTELLLSECGVNLTPQISCPGGYTTVECTPGIYIRLYVASTTSTADGIYLLLKLLFPSLQLLQIWFQILPDLIDRWSHFLLFKFMTCIAFSVLTRKAVCHLRPGRMATPGKCYCIAVYMYFEMLFVCLHKQDPTEV